MIPHLVGNLRVEHLDELKAQISAADRASALDVGGISLIGVEGIRFLNSLCLRRFHRQCVSVHFKVDGPRTQVPAKGRETMTITRKPDS